MIVLDASAALELLLGTSHADAVRGFLAEEAPIHVPHLIDLEITQVLRKEVQAGQLAATRAEEALRDWLDLDVERHDHEPHIWRVWELRHSLTSYDAIYVALAEVLEATLITSDAKLARAHGHDARVTLV